MDFYSIFGWVGTALIVTAFFLNSTERLDSASRAYQLMNLVGAIGVGFNVYRQGAWPAVATQCTWGAIAIYTLAKTAQK